MRNDDGSGTLCVLLGEVGHLLGDFQKISGFPLMGFGKCKGLGFITNDVVGIGDHLVKRIFEESWDEGSGQREHKDLTDDEQLAETFKQH